MDFSPTPDEQAVLEDVRTVAPILAQRAPGADRAARFPVEDLDDLRRANLLALAVPRVFGGRGATTVAYVLAGETIAAADASLSIAWVMHTACGWETAHSAQPDTRAAILSDVVNNGAFICIAGSEGRNPDGSPHPLLCRRDGEEWVLDGWKGFASGSEAATYVLTGAKAPDDQHHSFLVRMDNPGVRVAECWDGMGMRASSSHGLAFEHCRVPESHRLTQSYKSGDFRNTSALFGLGLAATALGIAAAALDFAIQYSRTRPVADFNKQRLGDMSIGVEAARGVLWRAAWSTEREPGAAEPWVDRAKTLAVETAQRVTVDALRICGGNAYRQRFPLERHMRDAAALLLQGQRPDQLRIGLATWLLENVPSHDHHPNKT